MLSHLTHVVWGQTGQCDLWLWADVLGRTVQLDGRVLALRDELVEVDRGRDGPCSAVRLLGLAVLSSSGRHGKWEMRGRKGECSSISKSNLGFQWLRKVKPPFLARARARGVLDFVSDGTNSDPTQSFLL